MFTGYCGHGGWIDRLTPCLARWPSPGPNDYIVDQVITWSDLRSTLQPLRSQQRIRKRQWGRVNWEAFFICPARLGGIAELDLRKSVFVLSGGQYGQRTAATNIDPCRIAGG